LKAFARLCFRLCLFEVVWPAFGPFSSDFGPTFSSRCADRAASPVPFGTTLLGISMLEKFFCVETCELLLLAETVSRESAFTLWLNLATHLQPHYFPLYSNSAFREKKKFATKTEKNT
jgi:hypothetical protein